jgi:hypothetical protein
MSLRKSLFALPAVVAALAVASPAAASASVVSPASPAHTFNIGGFVGPLQPGSLGCRALVGNIQFALLTGNVPWASVLSNAFVYSGCGGAAI